MSNILKLPSNKKPFVIWLTGMPCSGKSTLARKLQHFLTQKGLTILFLDGDEFRKGVSSDLGFSNTDRSENIRRCIEFTKLANKSKIITIIAFISPLAIDREKARSALQNCGFIEVYCKASLETCEKRDVKGMYKKARLGHIINFTGIGSAYEEPIDCELVIDTDNNSVDESSGMLIKYIQDHGYIA